ncbi:MAG: hypothetical protein H6735_34075 [Alphaproteobacteria bacterium]|nr:hypothetical protein [Alphaproteobacteria bacterium]
MVPRIHELFETLGVELVRDCTWLGTRDLRSIDEPESPASWYDAWNPRAYRTSTCRSSDRCPLYVERSDHLSAEDLLLTTTTWIARCCSSERQFVGRSMNTGRYQGLLDEMGAGPSVREHLRHLGLRGRVIGHLFANSDGVHGWLDPGETTDLAEALGALPLPSFEASAAAMASFRRWHDPSGMRGSFYLPPDGYSFAHLSLAFVRTVATMASREQAGILWGNDLPLPDAA